MERYKNLGGNSGVELFECGQQYIKVKFKSSRTIYVYDWREPGHDHVENMKQLAKEGQGLNTYISQNVKKNYARTER